MAEEDSKAAGGEDTLPADALLGTCARCHRPLIRPSIAGGCLRCIVDFIALDENTAFDPVAGSEEVRRYSHFEIILAADGSLDELGHGAMGTTYRAIDTVLQSPVALKVIGGNVADSPAVRTRFLREARSAARLRHPNVASVFHYGEQDGECFYVMELVDGETLEERVRREGPLSPGLTIGIGVQIARALAAAEAQNVVHRDLKPSNVMLTASPGEHDGTNALTVKVIDFGLAKAVGIAATSGTSHALHGFLGTPAYASPEQFAAATDHRIDTRSDIYSLGVTLWYLLCGRTPFVGDTLLEVHARQSQPPFEQLAAARVPTCLTTLLRSMLALDPTARPQSARELLGALCRCQEKSGISRIARRRRHLAWVVVLMTFGTLAAAAFVWWHEPGSPAAATDKSLAVLPFENLSPDKADAFFTPGVQDEISNNLGRLSDLRVIDSESTDLYPPKDRDLSKIARELGVWHLLEGSLRREEGQVHVQVRLIDVRDAKQTWNARYDRLLTDVFAVQSEITHAVAERLHARMSPLEETLIDEPPTRDLGAYDLYLRSSERGLVFGDASDYTRFHRDTQIPMLEAAVERDPGFALAYCHLALAHDWMQRYGVAITADERVVDHRSLAEIALAKARRLRPDAGEVHLALATHYLLTTHDNEQAHIELDLARKTLPNNMKIESDAFQVARSQGRWEEAILCAERSIALDPRDGSQHFQLAYLDWEMRRYDDCEQEMDRTIALLAPAQSASYRLFQAMARVDRRADLTPMQATIDTITPEQDPGHVYTDKYRLLMALFAHDADAASRVLAGIAQTHIIMSGFPYPKAWFDALVARLRQDATGARAAFGIARVEVDRALQADASNGRLWGFLAMIDAGIGNKDEAVREARRGQELSPLSKSADDAPLAAAELAVVYAWTDQPGLACATLDEWANRPGDVNPSLQITYGNLRLNPLWDPLRADLRFAALVQKLALKPTR